MGDEEKGEKSGPGEGGDLAWGEQAGEEGVAGGGGDTPIETEEAGNRDELNIRAGGEEETAMRQE